jgi:hypothetical protein
LFDFCLIFVKEKERDGLILLEKMLTAEIIKQDECFFGTNASPDCDAAMLFFTFSPFVDHWER